MPLNNCARTQAACKLLTRNRLNLHEVTILFHVYYEVWNDNVQQQFVCFFLIVAIYCNTIKSFLSQFI